MKRKNQFVNARGQVIDTDDDVCPDGFGLRTSMMLLDGGLDELQREIATRYGRPAQIVDAIGRPSGNRPGHAFMSTSSGKLARRGPRHGRRSPSHQEAATLRFLALGFV